MKLSAPWAVSCLLMLGTALAPAHRYPHGEVTPLVLVRDGNFVIYTTEYGNGIMMGTTMFETVHAPDGTLITPKKKSSLSFSDILDLAHQGTDPATSSRDVEELERHTPPLGLAVSMHLLRPEGVAVTYSKDFGMKASQAWDDQLFFAWLERPTLKSAFQAPLGHCALIKPPGPIQSELIWAEGRVWFAWIRKADDFENLAPTKKWVTMLASYDPKAKKFDQKVLPEQSHYNTTLSINVVKGWLCVAWHCSKDGSYPGESMIVTHFEKASP